MKKKVIAVDLAAVTNGNRRDIRKVILIGGDSEDLWDLKRAKIRIKVVLPLDNNSRLLREVAEEIATLEEYAEEYKPETAVIFGSRKEDERLKEKIGEEVMT